MAHGLEARSPFLDTAVVEFGAGLPDRLRMRWGKGKVLLRRAMRGILPEAILDPAKMGFGAPLGAWFRSDLVGLRAGAAAAGPAEPALRVPADGSRRGPCRTALRRATPTSRPQIWALLTLESWLRQEKG